MKWLILIALISCGQKSPPARDVSDSDGDQIPNYLEASDELQKYVAEVIPFSRTKGKLTFKLGTKIETVNFSNDQDIERNAMKFLTKSLRTLKTEEYFSEWSILKLEANELIIKDGFYSVMLTFETGDRPDYIAMTDGKGEIEIGPYATRMEFRLSADELGQILTGKLHLKMKKYDDRNPYSVESTVRDRTYRVFYFDGKTSKIHYVANELEFFRYLKLAGVKESYELKNFSGFSQTNEKDLWWTRNVGTRDKIVVKSSLKALSEFHLSNFNVNQGQLKRSNGSSVNTFTVKKTSDLKYVMKIRGYKILNVIKESTRKYHIGGPAQDDCRQWMRTIVSAQRNVVTKDDLLSSITITSRDKSGSLEDFAVNLSEGTDKDGWYLEIAMDETPEEFTFVLNSRPKDSYVMTGVYRDECKPSHDLIKTNIEGQMSLNIESFVEKID